MKQIRFLSNNGYKIKEAIEILKPLDVEIIPIERKIEELQTDDVRHLVEEKALNAFRSIGRPLFVEHTGLFVEKLNKLPGGLPQVFWDKLQAKFAELFGGDIGESKAKAITTICYIDGKDFNVFLAKLMAVYHLLLKVIVIFNGIAYLCQMVKQKPLPKWELVKTTLV